MSFTKRYAFVEYNNIPYIQKFGIELPNKAPLAFNSKKDFSDRTIIRSNNPNHLSQFKNTNIQPRM